MSDQPLVEHTTITRHITETRWYCVDKERCAELDEMIAAATAHYNSLSADVADKHITGLECLEREAKLQMMLKDLRAERAQLWRRGKKEIEEVVDTETGNVLATNRKAVLPRPVSQETFEAEFVGEPSVEGKPLVRMRHVAPNLPGGAG